MTIVSMKALLESGVHFGHRTQKWNPAMKSYIFTERNSIHIIDLQQTVKALEEAYNLVRDTVAEGGTVLFVGTKRQAQETIQDEAIRVGMPYVTNRWLGGMLTNWTTIRQRVSELEELERMRDRGDFGRITKKEALNMSRRIERLEYLLGGIRYMTQQPDLLFVVDVRREDTAIHEANLLNIPIVAMVDTNCDPRKVDYVIPSNDDAIRAIKLLVNKIAEAVVEGQELRKDVEEEFTPVTEVVMAGIDETELTDEDLLGAATLAKISASRVVAVEESVAEAEVEAVGEAVVEEIALEEAELEAVGEAVLEEIALEEAELEAAGDVVLEEIALEEAELEAVGEAVLEEIAEEEAELEAAGEAVVEERAEEEAELEAVGEAVLEEVADEEVALEIETGVDVEDVADEEAELEAVGEAVVEEIALEEAELEAVGEAVVEEVAAAEEIEDATPQGDEEIEHEEDN
ncbi:MAG: 30S ribosomal protein S2 [Anaerolineales bacterium]